MNAISLQRARPDLDAGDSVRADDLVCGAPVDDLGLGLPVNPYASAADAEVRFAHMGRLSETLFWLGMVGLLVVLWRIWK